MNHDGCMHGEFCVADHPDNRGPAGPRVLATLTINPAMLPLTKAQAEHLDAMVAMLACGEHRDTATFQIYEPTPGLGPALVVRMLP